MGWKVNGSTLMGSKMYSPPDTAGKKLYIHVSKASPPSFQELRCPSRLMVSVTCKRCSRVWRGRIDERPKPSMTLMIRVDGAELLLLDCSRSRENCARRWLTSLQEKLLVKDNDPVSVATCSWPLSLMAKVVSGLAGSRKTLFCPQ